MRSLIVSMRGRAAIVLLALVLAGCSYPQTRVETVDTRPTIAVANAPSGSLLAVNGVVIGPAQDFDGKPKTLRLTKGMHRIEIRSNEIVVYRETVFLANDTHRTIMVR